MKIVVDIYINEKAFIIGLAFEWSISLGQNDVSQSSGTKVDIEGQVARGGGGALRKGVERPGLVTNRSFVPRQWGVYFRAGWGYNVGTIL